MSRSTLAVLGLGAALLSAAASAQIDARMLRYPDVSATQIAFVYAGDIWVVAEGGRHRSAAVRPAGRGDRSRASRPDGSTLAFSANYDGNIDVYVVPRRRRRAGAPHAPPGGRPRARLVPRRQAIAVRHRR